MKLHIYLFLTFLFVVTYNKAYGQLKNITITSYEIVSYNFFSEKITLNLTINNDSIDFAIKSITGLVYKDRNPFVTVTAANLYLPHGKSTIGVVCSVSRCTSVSFFKLVQCLLTFNIKDYSVDVAAAIQYPQGDIQYKDRKNIVVNSLIKLQ